MEESCENCRSTRSLKKCTRCRLASYCSQRCQRENYVQHRDVCNHVAEFHGAKNRLPDDKKKTILENPWFMGVSYFIGSLPDHFRYETIGQRILVILKIISPIITSSDNTISVTVCDVTNKFTNLRFELSNSDELESLHYKLRVGSFVLIVQARLTVCSYTNKMSVIIIRDLNQVEFII